MGLEEVAAKGAGGGRLIGREPVDHQNTWGVSAESKEECSRQVERGYIARVQVFIRR